MSVLAILHSLDGLKFNISITDRGDLEQILALGLFIIRGCIKLHSIITLNRRWEQIRKIISAATLLEQNEKMKGSHVSYCSTIGSILLLVPFCLAYITYTCGCSILFPILEDIERCLIPYFIDWQYIACLRILYTYVIYVSIIYLIVCRYLFLWLRPDHVFLENNFWLPKLGRVESTRRYSLSII